MIDLEIDLDLEIEFIPFMEKSGLYVINNCLGNRARGLVQGSPDPWLQSHDSAFMLERNVKHDIQSLSKETHN